MLLLTNVVLAQNNIEIYNDKPTIDFYENLGESLKRYKLDSIQNSNEKIIRLWQGQEVYTIKETSVYHRRFTNFLNDTSYIYEKRISKINYNPNVDQVKNLEQSYIIDCFPIAIEIVENKNYFVKVVGCNNGINSIIGSIYSREVSKDIQEFIWNLPSGQYANYLTSFTINQPIKKDTDKTKFYKKVESELIKKNISIIDPTNQPLIIINSETAYFEDINKLDEATVKSFKVLGNEYSALYGTRAQFGVIIIETY